MMRNTLPPFLQQLVAPVFQLRRQGLNAADLFDFEHFDSCGAMVTEVCFWELNQPDWRHCS